MKKTFEYIATFTLFIFFIHMACSWQRTTAESLQRAAWFEGTILCTAAAGYVIFIACNLLRRRLAKVKKAISLFTPCFTLQSIAGILLAVFLIVCAIARKETLESNFTLSLRIAGIIWTVSVLAEYTIRNRRKKKYDKILNCRLRESLDREKRSENTI